jgi:CheY-like chemotaxis protein
MNELLLVDGDPFRLSVLGVGLRQSGWDVTTVGDGAAALDKVDWDAPDLVVTDTHLPTLDGFALLQTMKKDPELAAVPVVLLASEPSVADEKHAIALGADDYVPRPVYVRELAARIRMLLANRARESAGAQLFSTPAGRGLLTGSTRDLALADLLQDICGAGATGVVRLRCGAQEAYIFFRGGNVVDAQLGPLRGEEVVYRTLLWDDALFDVKFRPIPNEDVIQCTMQTLVTRGMDRVDAWLRPQLLARLGALGELPERLKAMSLPPAPRDSNLEPLKAAPMVALPPAPSAQPASEAARPDSQTTVTIDRGPDLPTATPIAPPRDEVPATAVEATAAPNATPSSVSQTLEAHPGAELAHDAEAPVAGVPPAAVLPRPAEFSAPPASDAGQHPMMGSDVPTATIAGSDSDRSVRVVPCRDEIPPAAGPEAVEPTAALRQRAYPSSAPWVREAHPGSEPPDDGDVHAAGVPRAVRKATKRIGGAAVGVAAVLGVVVFLHSVRDRQMREAEQARGTGAVAAPAAPSVVAASAKPPAAVAAKGAPDSSLAEPLAEISGGVAGATAALAPAPPGDPSPQDLNTTASPAAMASPPKDAREMLLDTRVAIHSHSPLVRDAQLRLLKGDTVHGSEVAQKAVSSEPFDAEAWLTLAAARLVVGDRAGAAEAYRACMAQAQTIGVTDCRVLAGGMTQQQ